MNADATLAELLATGVYQPTAAQKTQRLNTVATYVDLLKHINLGLTRGRTLDYAGGRGHGTKALRGRGISMDLYEPFPGPGMAVPAQYTALDASDLEGPYDLIVCANVLNVLPLDVRTAVVERIGSLLGEGGEAWISVRAAQDDVGRLEGKGHLELGRCQYVIQNGPGAGAFQKGFTPEELAAWLEAVLPADAFEIEIVPWGNVACRVVKGGRWAAAIDPENSILIEYGWVGLQMLALDHIDGDHLVLVLEEHHEQKTDRPTGTPAIESPYFDDTDFDRGDAPGPADPGPDGIRRLEPRGGLLPAVDGGGAVPGGTPGGAADGFLPGHPADPQGESDGDW